MTRWQVTLGPALLGVGALLKGVSENPTNHFWIAVGLAALGLGVLLGLMVELFGNQEKK